jgi:putative FmdB family regulatory protein
MPTYEYRCPNGHEFEHFFRTISKGVTELKCPTCGQMGQRKVSGGSGLLFRGSGFYITDYGKDGKKGQKSAERGEGTGTSGSAEGGGEKASGSGPGEGEVSSSAGKDKKSAPKKADE